jgi:hypothetical protein
MCMLRARVVPATLIGEQPSRSANLAIGTSSEFALVSAPTYKDSSRIQSLIQQTGIEAATWDIQSHRLTHGAEPFLRSRQMCSYSRISQHTWRRVQVMKLNFLQPPDTLSPFGPNIHLNTLF